MSPLFRNASGLTSKRWRPDIATPEYWQERLEGLIGPGFNVGRWRALTSTGMSPRLGFHAALQLLILGRAAEAHQILDYYLPRMTERMNDLSWTKKLTEARRRAALAEMSRQLHLGTWYRTGRIDPALASRALEHELGLKKSDSLHSMLAHIEAGHAQKACEHYLSTEKSPVEIPPTTFRFAKNPRSVLYLAMVMGSDPEARETVEKALGQFLEVTTEWEKDIQPIEGVGIEEAARMVRACLELRGDEAGVGVVTGMLK